MIITKHDYLFMNTHFFVYINTNKQTNTQTPSTSFCISTSSDDTRSARRQTCLLFYQNRLWVGLATSNHSRLHGLRIIITEQHSAQMSLSGGPAGRG